MVSPEERLKKLGIDLPGMPSPLGAYVPSVRSGNLLFLSGMLPLRKGKLSRTGRVGAEVSVGDAQEDARQAVINALSIVRAEIGSLGKVVKCVKVVGFVASATDFIQQPAVLNAASELLLAVFGDRGKHTRVAVGVPVLPLNSPLEIEFIFEVTEKEPA
ncbi:MAG TPA: RidA family protein [Thermodesulfovibrionales bacterium]|nr:RidA family protein [Thermodesulfovibrionales bacterium]